jgi:hypothetical protein
MTLVSAMICACVKSLAAFRISTPRTSCGIRGELLPAPQLPVITANHDPATPVAMMT